VKAGAFSPHASCLDNAMSNCSRLDSRASRMAIAASRTSSLPASSSSRRMASSSSASETGLSVQASLYSWTHAIRSASISR